MAAVVLCMTFTVDEESVVVFCADDEHCKEAMDGLDALACVDQWHWVVVRVLKHGEGLL